MFGIRRRRFVCIYLIRVYSRFESNAALSLTHVKLLYSVGTCRGRARSTVCCMMTTQQPHSMPRMGTVMTHGVTSSSSFQYTVRDCLFVYGIVSQFSGMRWSSKQIEFPLEITRKEKERPHYKDQGCGECDVLYLSQRSKSDSISAVVIYKPSD